MGLTRPDRVAADTARAITALARARLVRGMRPDRYARAVAAVARWDMTAAAGYVAAAAMYPGEPAIVDESGTLTFAEVHERTNRLASALAGHGIVAGTPVAILCRNHRGFVEALVALSKLGADALLLNTDLAGPQLAAVLAREDARTVIYDGEFSAALRGALRGRRGIIALPAPAGRSRRPTLAALIAEGDGRGVPPPGRAGRTTILTSGTTGPPKGVARGAYQATAALSMLDAIPLRSRERVLIAPPLFHQWGLAHVGLGLLLSSTLVLARRFDPQATLATSSASGSRAARWCP